jgi:hypothetical protein
VASDAPRLAAKAPLLKACTDLVVLRFKKNGAPKSAVSHSLLMTAVEPQVGIEPTTARLRIECSTPELLWQPTNYMPWRGFEPRRLAAPPPQDGVSTSFTTRALIPARGRRGSNPQPLE